MGFEETFVNCASPSFCGLKPASLFSLNSELYGSGSEKISEWNSYFSNEKISIIPIQKKGGRILVLVLNRKLISILLKDKKVLAFLETKNYPVEKGSDAILSELVFRLMSGRSFPHETGCFLGYPVSDVIKFEENGGKDFSYSGIWKVYGNVNKAKSVMKSYRSCTEECRKFLFQGMTMQESFGMYIKKALIK